MLKMLKRINKMVRSIKNTVFYQSIFECDKALIPRKSNKSIIERCSKNLYAYKYNKIVKEAKSDEILIIRSSLNENVSKTKQEQIGAGKNSNKTKD